MARLTPYGKPQGSEGGGPVKNGTANTNSLSGRSSIGNDTASPGKPLGKHQEECQLIIDGPI